MAPGRARPGRRARARVLSPPRRLDGRHDRPGDRPRRPRARPLAHPRRHLGRRADRGGSSARGVWAAAAPRTPREEHVEFLMLLSLSEQFYENPGGVALIRRLALENPHPQSPEAFARQVEASGRHETRDRLGALPMPVHVIGAEHDILVPAWKSRELAELVPASRAHDRARGPARACTSSGPRSSTPRYSTSCSPSGAWPRERAGSPRLGQRAHDRLVEALAVARLADLAFARAARRRCRGRAPGALRTRKKRPTTAATPRSSRESPTAMHSSGA